MEVNVKTSLVIQRITRLILCNFNLLQCIYIFRCDVKHKFSLSLEDLRNKKWCKRCADNYVKYVKRLRGTRVKLISKILRNIVIL